MCPVKSDNTVLFSPGFEVGKEYVYDYNATMRIENPEHPLTSLGVYMYCQLIVQPMSDHTHFKVRLRTRTVTSSDKPQMLREKRSFQKMTSLDFVGILDSNEGTAALANSAGRRERFSEESCQRKFRGCYSCRFIFSFTSAGWLRPKKVC